MSEQLSTKKTLRLKPAAKGLVVRDPVTARPLAEKGENKPRNSYWLRRIAEGSVVDVDVPKANKPEAKSENKEGADK